MPVQASAHEVKEDGLESRLMNCHGGFRGDVYSNRDRVCLIRMIERDDHLRRRLTDVLFLNNTTYIPTA